MALWQERGFSYQRPLRLPVQIRRDPRNLGFIGHRDRERDSSARSVTEAIQDAVKAGCHEMASLEERSHAPLHGICLSSDIHTPSCSLFTINFNIITPLTPRYHLPLTFSD